MNKKAIKFTCLLVLCLFSISLLGCNSNTGNQSESESSSPEPSVFIWGSGALGSTGYVIMEAFCATINRNEESLKNSSISTGGSGENMLLISQGEIQFGHGTSLDFINAREGTGMYKQPIKLDQVFSYQNWAMPLLVLKDSEIQTMNDLKGKRVSIGAAGSGAAILWEGVLEAAGLKGDIVITHLGFSEGKDALISGQIDAVVATFMANGSIPAPIWLELAASHEYRVVDVEKEVIEKFNNPGVFHGIIPKEAQPFFERDYGAPMYPGILAVDPLLDEDSVYKAVKALYENEEEVRGISQELSMFSLDYALKDIIKDIPIHPGAAKYYKEKGIWKDDLIVGN